MSLVVLTWALSFVPILTDALATLNFKFISIASVPVTNLSSMSNTLAPVKSPDHLVDGSVRHFSQSIGLVLISSPSFIFVYYFAN